MQNNFLFVWIPWDKILVDIDTKFSGRLFIFNVSSLINIVEVDDGEIKARM